MREVAWLLIGVLLSATFFTLAACDPDPPTIGITIRP